MFRKIGTKLILVVSVTAVIIIGVFSYFNIERQTEVLRKVKKKLRRRKSEIEKKNTDVGLCFFTDYNLHHCPANQ